MYVTEIEERKKQLDVTDEQVAEWVAERIDKEKPMFSNETDRCQYYAKITREVIWNYVNKTEAEQIIFRLKSGDTLFAQNFFYGKDNSKCNISRFRSKLIGQIRQTYHYDMSVEEFGNIVYTHLWSNGSWSVLDTYGTRSSFFGRPEQVARHEVIRTLEEMNIVNVNRERSVGNTRLLGASVEPKLWEVIINDIMPIGRNRDLLLASYAQQMNTENMEKTFCLNASDLKEAIKKAEAELRDKLIRSDSFYEEAGSARQIAQECKGVR